MNVQKFVIGADSTTLLPSPVKLNDGAKVAVVCGMPLYNPVPVRNRKSGLKLTVVCPPPLGPEADVLPLNAADPLIEVSAMASARS